MPRPKGSKVVDGKLVMPSNSESKRIKAMLQKDIFQEDDDVDVFANDSDLAEEKYNAILAIVKGDYIKHNDLIIIGG